MAYYPEGKWYRLFIEKYEENVFKKFEEDIMKGKCIEENNVQEPIPEQLQLQQIKVRLEEVIICLNTAIERGNDLHLGIVLGQSLKELTDITYG